MRAHEDLRAALEAAGQAHLWRHAQTLPTALREAFLARLAETDWASIRGLVDRYVLNKPSLPGMEGLAPAPYYPADPASPVRPYDAARYRRAGERLLSEGKVAAFVVAGGQGTRLGFEGPKGCYPATPVRRKPLFQVFAEQVLAAQRRYGRSLAWYVMTSPLNHEETVSFFRRHNSFGLSPDDVRFFQQGVMPTFEMGTGRILLAAPGVPATNPDGHGGSLRALAESGALAEMRSRGVEHISYFQVDNPLVKVFDPLFIGLHAEAPDSSGQMSSKMVLKTGPEEKVGVFCRARTARGERTVVIEYSDLPAELARARDPDGSLLFAAGSIAVHLLGVSFVDRLNTDPSFALPWHRAEKKTACIDPETGRAIEPREPNSVKLERFVFDALAFCESSIVLQTRREEEFAPIKNASGVDSAESSRALQSARAARWLASAGVAVPMKPDGTPDCTLEISPLTALEPADLKRARLPERIERGASVAL